LNFARQSAPAPEEVLSSEHTRIQQRVEFAAAIGSVVFGMFFILMVAVRGFFRDDWPFLCGGLGAIAMGAIWLRSWRKYVRPATKVVMDEDGLVYYEGDERRRVRFQAIESIKAAPWLRKPTMMITYRDVSGRIERFMFYPKFMGYSLLSSFDRVHLLLDTKRQEKREKRARSGAEG